MIQSYAVPEGISKGQAFDEDDDDYDDEGEGSTSDAGVMAKYPHILSSLASSSSYSGAAATSSSSSAPVADSAVEPSPISSIDANMSTAEWHDKLRVLCNCAEDGFSRDRFG